MITTYLKNRASTKAVDKMAPCEACAGLKPDLSHLRVFGCKAQAHIPDCKRKNLIQRPQSSFLLVIVKIKRVID